MKFGKGLIFIAVASLLMAGVSCDTLGNKQGEVVDVGNTGSGPINAQGFLKTDYEPLKKWLDERFEVDYKHMTPQLIFDQVPLNDINYETVSLPGNAQPFDFSSSDVSRRELLKKVSSFWRLKMSLVNDGSGNPVAVRVEG